MTRNDRGFTLVEVVVSTVLAGIVFAALTQALIVGLKTLDATNDRVSESNDQQLIATYFTTDVESAETVSAGSALHAAPDVRPTDKGSLLMTFTALETDAVVSPSSRMVQGWSIASAGVSSALRVRSLMSSEQMQLAGSTGQRVARTDSNVRSVSQSIALKPNGVIALRNVWSGSGSASTFVMSKPIDTVQNDVIIAHLVVNGGSTTTITAPSGWTVVGTKQLGAVLTSVIYSKVAGVTEPDTWSWTFNGPRDAAGGMAAYSRVSTSSPVPQQATATSGCGTGTTLLRAVSDEWSMVGGVATATPHRLAYETATVDGATVLERLECDSDGNITASQTIARRLNSANAATVSCEPFAKCEGLPVKVTLNVNELPLAREEYGRTLSFRAVTRAQS